MKGTSVMSHSNSVTVAAREAEGGQAGDLSQWSSQGAGLCGV